MDINVLILGTDMNAYYMARCYHELYHKKADMVGKQRMSFTSLSNIINLSIIEDLSDNDVFLRVLKEYAENHKGQKNILIASNDAYVRMIVENKEILEKNFLFNYPTLEIMDKLLVKDKFYEAFKDSGLDLPVTFIYSCKDKNKITEKFMYPIVLKPGNGVEYYKHHFEGMSKVYKIKSEEELMEVIKKIEDSGYEDNLVIQEFIPGDDSALFDSIFYCSKDKEVQLITFAQIGYQGFAEFDLKYDERDGKYKVFEINPRQARSSYYLTACGHNLIKYLVDDLVHNKKKETFIMKDEMLLSFVPKIVIKKYVTNPKLKKEINKLLKSGKFCRPLHYKGDKNFKRKVYLLLRDINYYKKYKNLEW